MARYYKPMKAYKAEFQKVNRKFLLKTGFTLLAAILLAGAFWIAK